MDNVELIKLLWEELRYRHDLFWRLYFRSVLASLTLIAVPLLYVDQLSKALPGTGLLVLFPISAIIVALIATWMLFAELRVLRGVLRAYRSLLTAAFPPELVDTYTVGTRNAGTIMNAAFCGASLAISGLEMYLLWGK